MNSADDLMQFDYTNRVLAYMAERLGIPITPLTEEEFLANKAMLAKLEQEQALLKRGKL